MDDRQEDKLSMYQVVATFLADNQPTWTTIPVFGAARTALLTEITTIQSLGQAQQHPSTGVTLDKRELRSAMADAAMPVVGAAKALAAVTGNHDLAAQVRYTRSDFAYGRDLIAADKADIVHAVATQHAAALVSYGIAQAQLDGLRSAIDDFREISARPRTVIATRTADSAQLESAFTRADQILSQQLDNLIELFRVSQPAFYLGYQSARRIVSTGGRTSDEPDPNDGDGDDNGGGGGDNGGGGSELPDTPGAPMLTPLTPTQLQVQWTLPARATAVNILRQTDGVDLGFVEAGNGMIGPATLTELPPGGTIRVRLIALNTAGESPPGPISEITMPMPPP